MKKLVPIILALAIIISLSTPALAAAPTTKEVFNSAPLTPRQSTNPTLAKYVDEVMKEIDPKGNLSTYDKVLAAYNWTAKNITFEKHYTLPVEVTTYLEDAAIHGFRERKGPCEVDSAPLVYLLRYIGLDAQWAYGRKGGQYHWWTEVIIGGNVYAFDTYPGQTMSFLHRTSTVQGQTDVNGFSHYGYFVRGGPKAYGVNENGNNLITSNAGTMARMDPPRNSSGITKTIVVTFSDGTSYSWGIPAISQEQMTMASIDKFYNPADSENKIATMKLGFADLADRTVPVYTIKTGANISLEGASMLQLVRLKLVDGKLQSDNTVPIDWDKETVFTGGDAQKVYVGSKSYSVLPKGAYVSFATGGEYYLMELLPWNECYFDTNPKSSTFGKPYVDCLFRHGYVILRVKK